MRRWKQAEKYKLIHLYLSSKITITEIAKILGRSNPAIHDMVRRLKIANRCKIKVRLPTRVSPEEARVHAHICGDGSLSITKRKRRKTIELEYRIRYTNSDDVLLEEFKRDVNAVYNRSMSKSGYEVGFSSKRVFKHLKELGAGGSYSWSVSSLIYKGSFEIRKMWLRAFWDDKGTVRTDGLLASSVNYLGLAQACGMMQSVGVKAHITGPYQDKGSLKWHMRVNKMDVAAFLENVGFLSPRKSDKLAELVRNRCRNRG